MVDPLNSKRELDELGALFSELKEPANKGRY